MHINSITGYAYRLPFRNPVSLPGSVLTRREGLLVALEAENGQRAWGEAAPLSGFSAESLEEASEQARSLAHQVKDTARIAMPASWPVASVSPSVHFAFESALLTLAAQAAGLPLHHYLNAGAPDRLPLCALLEGTADEKQERAHRALQHGYTTLKLKVGRTCVEEDATLVRAILRICPPEVHLRLDANRAWSQEQALQFCESLPMDRIAFLEEPVRDFHDIPEIQGKTGIACAADETLQELSRCVLSHQQSAAEEMRSVAELVQYLVWKPSLCLPLSLLAVQTSAPIVLSAAYETGVGTAAILAYAAAFSGTDSAAGVDTYTRLASDVLASFLPLEAPEADLAFINTAWVTPESAKLERLWYV